jgi:hypothetical protein
MVGSDDILACFIAGNTFTWESVTVPAPFSSHVPHNTNTIVAIGFGLKQWTIVFSLLLTCYSTYLCSSGLVSNETPFCAPVVDLL